MSTPVRDAGGNTWDDDRPPPRTPAVDRDAAAAAGRHRRLIVEIERVAALAADHRDEHADWRDVAVLLDRLRAALSRELPVLPLWSPTVRPVRQPPTGPR